jgi:hypothetical protein
LVHRPYFLNHSSVVGHLGCIPKLGYYE